jgi:hypothetical protein
MAQGYIYALINSSLHGLVKVGKTVKEPEIRAKEISSDTGVPTPFIVAFKVLVSDCDSGELFLHSLLQTKGFRINQKREFFNAPLDVIISSMIELQKSSDFIIATNSNQIEKNDNDVSEFNFEDDFLNELEIEQVEQIPAFVDVLDNAENLYYGLGETIQDHSDALTLYKHAVKLGGIEAYSRIGQMYQNGEGCNIDHKLALNYLKEGVSKGNENCYFHMGMLFSESNNYVNMNKCFRKYFSSSTFIENKQNKVIFNDRISNLGDYFYLINGMGLNVETDILQIFDKLRIEIDDFFENRIAYLKIDTQYKTLIDNYEATRKKLFDLLDGI